MNIWIILIRKVMNGAKKVAKLYYTALGRERNCSYKAILDASELIENQTTKKTYSAIIRYIDEADGNEIMPSIKTTVNEGDIYDFNNDKIDMITYNEIKYKIAGQSGSPLQGTVNGDINIVLKYRKANTYTVTLHYVDRDGSSIGLSDEILFQGYEGDTYNVLNDVQNRIENINISNYLYYRTEGASSTGTLNYNKIINLVYVKMPTPIAEIKNNMTKYFGSTFTTLSPTPATGGADGKGKEIMSISATFKPVVLSSTLEEQMIVSTTEKSGWALRICEENKIDFEIYFNGEYIHLTPSSVNLDRNQTYHVVGTYDGEYMKLYINGSLVKAKSMPNMTITQKSNVRTLLAADPYIGDSAADSGGKFYGYIYDAKLYYDEFLNSAQVKALYQQQKSKYGF